MQTRIAIRLPNGLIKQSLRDMLICSCAVISDHDVELALLDILIQENAPLPTPGVVWRHLQKKLNCCGCAPLAVETIYTKLEELRSKGLICPYALANARHALDRRRRSDNRKHDEFRECQEVAC